MMDTYPLAGLLVADVSSGIPGAYCAKQLADGGAEVVRLEPPEGDDLRRWAQHGPLPTGETGALFQYLGCSTKSVAVDPRSGDDLDLASRVLAAADVIVWSPGGVIVQPPAMSAQELHARYPAAIVAAITPFGLTGPWVGRPATDLTIQAWAGASTLGSQDRPPVQWGGRIGDWLGGIFAAIGVLAARRRQAVSGLGDLIDVSLLEVTQFCAGMYAVTRRTMSTPELLRAAAKRPNRSIFIPMIERTTDGWVGFMVATAVMWQSFSVMMGHPEWGDDESLYPYDGRAARRAELEAAIREWVGQRTTAEVLELAALMRVPAAPIGTGASIPSFEHFAARGAYVPNPATGWLQPDVPYTFSGNTRARPFSAAPAIGEHTAAERTLRRPAKAAPASWPVPEPSSVPELPFAGHRVADFTAYWAGPVVSHLLAILGADVIHVESPKHPDEMRKLSLRKTDDPQWFEWCPNFHGPNTNKRSVTIDMGSEEGRQVARRLIAHCDIMLENYSPRVMAHWGLEYSAVREIRPDIIMMRLPAFGLTGPWRDRTGYAQTMEQVSGLAWLTGFPDGPPLILHGTCDPLAGAHATAALLLALEQRRRTGEGVQVEVAMVGGALNISAEQVLEYQAYGNLMERRGNAGLGAPHNLYGTADVDEAGRRDTWVAIVVETDEQWCALRDALGRPAWALDERLLTADGRGRARDLLDKHLSAWCLKRGADEVVATLWPRGVPVARVTPGNKSDGLEQHAARGFYEPLVHPITGEQLHMRYPVSFARGPLRHHRTPPPTLGQHNDEVLGGMLGISDDERSNLEDAGVIGTRLIGSHRAR